VDTVCPQSNAVESLADLSVDNEGLSSTEGLSGSGGGLSGVLLLDVGLFGLFVCGLSSSECGLSAGGLSATLGLSSF